ncbi:MAG: LamG-like jellyroll fold domain-containing protein [Planctomycetia bacterium]|nr:LamG-like jellyroll fold domain-containing protein [Planctomycetia bacterium]
MSNRSADPFSLIDDFLENRLSEADAAALLEILKKGNPALIKMYRDNARMNFLLREKAAAHEAFAQSGRSEILDHLELEDLEKEYYKDSDTEESSVPGDFKDLDQWDDLTDLIAWEKSVQPITPPLMVQKEPEELPPSWKTTLVRWLSPQEREIRPDKTEVHRSPVIGIICALLLLCVIGAAEILHFNQLSKSLRPTFNAVGTIVEIIDVQWTPGSRVFKRGESIAADNISLQRGMVKMILANGVELILEGPGEYVVNSPMNTFCKNGSLSVKVPPEGIGFEVATRFGSIVDRGTEFFVEVYEKSALVETIRGKVDVSLLKSLPISLPFGDGIQIDSSFKAQSVPKLSGRFVDTAHFEEKLIDYTARKKEESKVLRQKEWNMPNLLAGFDFSDPLQKMIPNCSVNGLAPLKEAELYGGRSGEGALYGEKALILDQAADSVRFDLPGSFKNLSVIAHVRIDHLLKFSNVLFASQQHHNEPGAFLWQIMNDGRMQIQITPPQGEMQETCFYSDPILSVQNFGTWVTLAFVAEGSAKRIAFYCDGKLAASVPWTNSIPLSPGLSMIGNILYESQNREIRALSGAIKDFMIFDRALSEEEVKTLSQNRL